MTIYFCPTDNAQALGMPEPRGALATEIKTVLRASRDWACGRALRQLLRADPLSVQEVNFSDQTSLTTVGYGEDVERLWRGWGAAMARMGSVRMRRLMQ